MPSTCVGSMLDHRRRRWPNIKPTLDQSLSIICSNFKSLWARKGLSQTPLVTYVNRRYGVYYVVLCGVDLCWHKGIIGHRWTNTPNLWGDEFKFEIWPVLQIYNCYVNCRFWIWKRMDVCFSAFKFEVFTQGGKGAFYRWYIELILNISHFIC